MVRRCGIKLWLINIQEAPSPLVLFIRWSISCVIALSCSFCSLTVLLHYEVPQQPPKPQCWALITVPSYLVILYVFCTSTQVSKNAMYSTLVKYTSPGQKAMIAPTSISLSPSKYNPWLAPGFLVWHLRQLDIKLVTMRSCSLSESSARFNGFVSSTTVLNNH